MIIGISGKIGSGKDTIGKMIQYLTADPKQFRKNHIDEYIGGSWHYNDRPLKEWSLQERLNDKFFLNELNVSSWQIKKFADKLKDIVCLLIGCTREQLEDREFKEKELGEEWWLFNFEGTLIPYDEKDIFQKEFSLSDEEVHSYLIKQTPRKLLQLLGTEVGREVIHPNIWVNALFTDYRPLSGLLSENTRIGIAFYDKEGNCKIKNLIEAPELDFDTRKFPNWIITDCRFPNEIQAIKDRGGIVIRVNRPIRHKEGIYGKMSKDVLRKVSERQQDEIARSQFAHPSETALDNYKDWDLELDNDADLKGLLNKVKIFCELNNLI